MLWCFSIQFQKSTKSCPSVYHIGAEKLMKLKWFKLSQFQTYIRLYNTILYTILYNIMPYYTMVVHSIPYIISGIVYQWLLLDHIIPCRKNSPWYTHDQGASHQCRSHWTLPALPREVKRFDVGPGRFWDRTKYQVLWMVAKSCITQRMVFRPYK